MHSQITIIGRGAWGNALYKVIKSNRKKVLLWDRKETPRHADIIVLAIPIQSIRPFLTHADLTAAIIINAAKGIERKTHKFPYQIVHDVLGNQINYFSLIGPSFAQEIVQKMPTLVNLGYRKPKHVSFVKSIFQTDYLKIKPTPDIELLELFAAFKNVYAILCGIAYGLGFGENTRAKLIVLALEELYRLTKHLTLSIHPTSLPGTVGDLVLTSHSEESRNFRFGEMLIKTSVKESLKKINQTVEGYNTIFSILYFVEKYKIDLPLMQFVVDVVRADDPHSVSCRFNTFIIKI